MRGLLGRVRATPQGGVIACGTSGNTALDVALQRVTHSQCAAVPTEALEEAVRLAGESEDALATVLRHVEEHATAPGREWRRVHGALALLERLMRPRPSGGHSRGPLVGRIWFDTKLQARLKTLSHFDFPEDPRVALVVRRAALTAQNTADKYLDACSDEELSTAPDSRDPLDSSRSAGSAQSGDTAVEKRKATTPRQLTPRSPEVLPQRDSPATPSLVGRPAPLEASTLEPPRRRQDTTAAAANAAGDFRRAASALDALREPDTRQPSLKTRQPSLKASPSALATRSSWESTAEPRRCCWCLRRAGRQAVPTAEPGEADGDIDEVDSLL